MEDNFEEMYDTNEEMYDTMSEPAAADGETKADKFRRLASARTNNAIKQITGIGKLSTSAYEYTPEQVEKIFTALQDALDAAKQKFDKTKPTTAQFTL